MSIDFVVSRLWVEVKYIPLFTLRHFNVLVRRPCLVANETVRGLLGSPDRNVTNDWMTFSGAPIAIATERKGRAAFDYCTRNWCVASDDDRLLMLDSNASLGCNQTYPGNVNLTRASPEVRMRCGTNEACLIDGIELGIEGANNVLTSEAELSRLASGRLTVSPSSILVNQSTIVKFTVNLTGVNTSRINHFTVIQVDPVTLQRMSGGDVLLYDSAIGELWADNFRIQDSIFAGELALLSKSVGEVLQFQVVPSVFSDDNKQLVQSLTSPYTTTIRSYALESGLVTSLPTLLSRPVLRVATTDQLMVLIEVFTSPNVYHPDFDVCLRHVVPGNECGSLFFDPYILIDTESVSSSTALFDPTLAKRYMFYLGRAYRNSPWNNATMEFKPVSRSSTPKPITDLISIRISTRTEYNNRTSTSQNNQVQLSVETAYRFTGNTTFVARLVRASNASAVLTLSTT